ncbi:transposase [Streptomyces sp. NPDC017890]|uniref:transposase n=1 Tax=Streptomyces sp. NPDC017890 TaxID=3365015 RepID=UPI0037ADFB19
MLSGSCSRDVCRWRRRVRCLRRVRDQFNGVLWRFRTGSGRRDVPERYGPWSTVYSRLRARVEGPGCSRR